MSEMINNREYRQKVLKELITELHEGKSIEEVKERFAKLIEGVSPSEISEMENALIREGMPVSEVQRMCDVHAAVFKGSIEQIHMADKPEDNPGHPVFTFKMENRALERLINKSIRPLLAELKENKTEEGMQRLKEALDKLWEVDKHYSRKENLLFPFMEKYDIVAPPKVMWGVDDEIRMAVKEARRLAAEDADITVLAEAVEAAAGRVEEMIFKEENILFPMVLETLNEDEWLKIARESDDIGYCLYKPTTEWKPVRTDLEQKVKNEGEKPAIDGYVKFESGILNFKEIEAMLNTLPIDITFVDKDGIVKYFSMGKERIYARTKAVIGRKVQNCHPPASVHVVEKIVEDLKSGKKEHEDFWIKRGDLYVLIRYFAVRDKDGEFVGILEVSQNIAPIQAITGEKRLAD
ncbi:MAG: DUF438 domain-containing protein [Clostridiales bacterium]|nr:DUF438 domain-containing protein [Clostridiales bacterium]